jgi:hypothetical protein
LHCSGVVEMCNRFTHEEYANVHFAYGFCNVDGRAALVGYKQQYPPHRIPHCKRMRLHRTLRETGSLLHVNAECEQPWHGSSDVLVTV